MSKQSPSQAALGIRRGDRVWVWAVRVWWAALPFSAGPILADGLHHTAFAWRSTASLGAWVIWALVLMGSLIVHPATLLLTRMALSAAVAALLWAGMTDAAWIDAGLMAAITAGIAAIALSAPVGHVYVNGISYGSEVRLLLRPPVVLLLAPIPAAAFLGVAGFVGGPLLLSAQHWTLGAVAMPLGLVLAVISIRSLYALTQRWLVFVSAGVVLHDHLAIQDPLLLHRKVVASFCPAQQGTNAVDLTQGASGLILQVSAKQQIALSPAKRPHRFGAKKQPQISNTQAEALLVAPSRPGMAVALARQRLLD
ncbi:MAG: hypothetical protein F4119_03100 [Acidimicrobiia bacterium]|nr:hypothetical protein [Acidimicrobiia bacterium]MYI30333.1 hypothetical protein [Acidimicrobiia bacterium]